MAFECVMAEDELWEGEMLTSRVGGKRILLLREQGIVYAYEDRCPHQAVALSAGRYERGRITCSAHSWVFAAAGGESINPKGACLNPFAVKIEGGEILVDVDQAPVGMRSVKP